MNHPGEISVLGSVTMPTVALVNNAQREHQEFMVSVEAVALENAAVFDSLMPGGTKVFPADDAFTSLWADLAGQHASSTFGLTAPARVWASDIESDVLGSSFVLHTPLGQAEFFKSFDGMQKVSKIISGKLSDVERLQLFYLLNKLNDFHNRIFLNEKETSVDKLLEKFF
jgi:UDP-N-acetylmuramyl pentapeptide synthase